MTKPNPFSTNYELIMATIAKVAKQANRNPQDITLLAVSKKQSAETIIGAYEAGITNFGENYLQEARDKMQLLQHLPLTWHFIGPIQSNKAADIARHFDFVHSVDRLKIAQKLSAARQSHQPPLKICIQVNIDEEPTKSGVLMPELLPLAKQITQLPNIKLCGFMALPKPRHGLMAQRRPYHKLQCARTMLANEGLILDTLSVGSSQDYQAAILEGATIIRLGEALLGKR